jgi:alpha-galactosidase
MARLTRLITVAMLVRLGLAADFPVVAMDFAEIRELQRWMVAEFDGNRQAAQWGLVVLTNFDELCLNTRVGRSLAIGKKEYPRGVFCHAATKVAVRLPAPGKTFSAFVGVDSNSQTHGGRGSIVFSVTVAGKEAFRSKVMREGKPAERVNLDLGGATEFLLEVDDAGDGIACDQADWADAKITLADGRILWLGDLPIIEGQVLPAMSTDPPFSFTYGGQASAALLAEWRLDR